MSDQEHRQTIRALYGIDASRRVGWARYFDAVEETEEVRERYSEMIIGWIAEAVAMALAIQFHERLSASDPLVQRATDLLNRVGSVPAGHRLIEEVKREILR